MHVVVVDEDGVWTGQAGSVLETFPLVLKGSDSKYEDGSSAYYVNVINSQSKYILWGGHETSITDLGDASAGTNFGSGSKIFNYSFVGGADGAVPTDADKTRGYSIFRNKELIDIDIIISGAASQTLSTWLINNLAEYRKDCIVFISPLKSYVVNNPESELNSVVSYRNLLPSSSYAAMDDNWKYQYDRYNYLVGLSTVFQKNPTNFLVGFS